MEATKRLKIYKCGFTPITKDGRIGVSRDVMIVAYSEDQAKKLLRDWMVIRRKQNYFYEGIERVNKTSPEGKKALNLYGKRTIDEIYAFQNEYIYKGELHVR